MLSFDALPEKNFQFLGEGIVPLYPVTANSDGTEPAVRPV